uniref:Reverse transcriptase domain-containing protein n=1 Tax=Angiostrongylus cantonensis TaxID=6313 RepID=A0A0K0DMG6_ANGCA
MRTLEWDNMGVKIDGRQLHHLCFADDIVLITPIISHAERMLADFDKACGKIGLRLKLKKTMFMKNELVSFAPFTLNGIIISECSSYVYLEHRGCSEENMVHSTTCPPFDSTVLPVLTYASETWSLRKQDERSLSVIECAVERTILGVPRFTQVRDGIRSSDLCQRSKIKDTVLYAKQSKIRWGGHVMRIMRRMITDGQELLVTAFLGMSHVLQEDHRPDGQSSSRKPRKKI